MKYTPADLFNLIQNSASITDEERIDIFEALSTTYSIIPLVGGMWLGKGDPNEFKKPIESDWTQWCKVKRPFNRGEFYPERAGIACGPASGVLVLDVDNMTRFNYWLAQHGVTEPLPKTLTVKSGGYGERYHHYFKFPNDGQKYSNRDVKGTFDIKSIGGQVLCPGSLHPETRKPYTITENVGYAEAPAWLLNYSLYKSVTPPGVTAPASQPTTSTAPEAPPLPPMDFLDQDIPQWPPHPYLETLPISENLKQLIQTPFSKGQRSEPSMSTMIGLIDAGVDVESIKYIYDSFPIGEKSRDRGQAWFDSEIEKAKEYILKHNDPSKKQHVKPERKLTYGTISAFDVISKPIKFEYLIDKFWPKGEQLLITGHGGVGKSLMTLQIAMDLAYPPTIGYLETFKLTTKSHKSLFIQSENTSVGMKERIDEIKANYKIPDNVLKESIFFLGVNNDIRSIGDIMDTSFTDAIKASVDMHKIDIIFVDPLISFHSKDENSNDQMRRLLDHLALVSEEMGVSPVLIHHHSKATRDDDQGGGRGASSIGDWAPNRWDLKHTASGYELAHRKARNFALTKGRLLLELKHLRFKPKKSGAVSNVQLAKDALTNLNGKATTKRQLQLAIMNLYATQNPGKKAMVINTAGSRIKEAVAAGVIVETPVAGSKNKSYTFPE